MFPHSSPLVSEANEVSERSRFSSEVCPGVAAMVSVGAVAGPTEARRRTLEAASCTGPPPKAKVRFMCPGPALSVLLAMLAGKSALGLRFASRSEACAPYHQSRSLVPSYGFCASGGLGYGEPVIAPRWMPAALVPDRSERPSTWKASVMLPFLM